MILIENLWTESLEHLMYNNGFDVRIQAIQVALFSLSNRSSNIGENIRDDVEYSETKFGYFDVPTELSIKSFQKAINKETTGILDEDTYIKIFSALKNDLNCIIVETDDEKLKMLEVTDELKDFLGIEGSESNSYDEIYGNDLSEEENNIKINNNIEDMNNLLSQREEEKTDNFISKWNENYTDVYSNPYKDENNIDSNFYIYSKNNGGRTLPGYPNVDNNYNYNLDYGNSINGIEGNNHDFINNLLANSIYDGNLDFEKSIMWKSNSNLDININGYKYEKSEKYKPFFSNENSSKTRDSNYDITIVYGSNGQFAKKIVDVIHRSKSQQIDATGEAIYDVIEFIARDVIETDNIRK